MESKENANALPQSEDKALPSPALEYYKKYSQNRQLPKYFCGTSFKIEDWHHIPTRTSSSTSRELTTVAVNTEEIQEEAIKPSTSQAEYWARPPLIGQDHLCEPPKIPDINIVSDYVGATSPTSSVASNRKLEWDSGADIGYSNVETHKILHKSISLPVLTNFDYGELRKNLLRLSPEGNNTEVQQVQPLKHSSSEKSSNSDIIGDLQCNAGSKTSFNPPYSSSTSESVKSSSKNYISSSSSSAAPQQRQYFSDSDSTSDAQKLSKGVSQLLKEKVGIPLAESTPIVQIQSDQYNQDYCETPKLPKPKKTENNRELIENGNTLPVQNINVTTTTVRESSEKLSNSCENLTARKPEEGLKKWHSQIDLNMVDQVSHYKNLKVLKLSVSKPVVVECAGIYNASGKNKFIQTSLPRNVSVALQTDFDFTNCQNMSAQLKNSPLKNAERQSILYICHSESEKDPNTNSSGTQTNSDVLSNCNSFEYLYGADYDLNLKKSLAAEGSVNESPTDQSEVLPTSADNKPNEMSKFILTNLKRCPPKSDLTTLTPDSDKTGLTSDSSPSTSKESPLANLISSKPSEDLISDLQRNLQLLEKVIKSKKYDTITKKYCLKKIVQKMVDSKYAEDSSESCDISEKSSKKTSPKETIRQLASEQSEETSSNDNRTAAKNANDDQTGLHDNKPWLPVQQTSNKADQPVVDELPERKQPQSKILQIRQSGPEILPEVQRVQTNEPSFVPYQDQKLTNSNFVPIQVIHSEKTRVERNPLFTLTDHGLLYAENINKIDKYDHGDSSNSTENELYEVLHRSRSKTVTPITSSNDSSSSKQDKNARNNIRSWREAKTRSEELLEQKKEDFISLGHESRDHLVHFAKKEREHQLSWINNEISHLSKLKKLLEKGEKPKSTHHDVLQTILEKPRVEDMKGSKKSTTVYIVTTERSSDQSSCSPPCNLKTCKNPRCRGRFASLPSTSSNESAQNRERIPSSKPICKCDASLCTCKSELPNLNLRPPSLVGRGGTIANIGNEAIDLQNARLVSSEQFTTNNDSENRRASVRRYTFEIPLDNIAETAHGPAHQPRQIEGSVIRSPPSSPKPETNKQVSSPSAASPKRASRLSCELVITDEIVGAEKSNRSSSPHRCTCNATRSTSPKRVGARGCTCRDKNIQTSESLLDLKNSSSSSSSSESDSTSDSCPPQLCRCCKQRCDNMLRARLEASKRKATFCHPCYNQNKVNAYCMYPGHICRCYNADQAENIQKMRDTIQALENLEAEEEYCKCLYANAHSSSNYCTKCRCKLKKKHKKHKGGMAYVLTLESDTEGPKKHKRKAQPVLEEIKIKVVSPTSTNSHRGQLSNDCSDACKCKEDSGKENSTLEKEKRHKKDKNRKNKSRRPTLQEYLCENKPNFIASAEQRRKCLLDLAYMREQRCQKYKQLLALTNGIPLKNSTADNTKKPHVFSSKEMKQQTAKKYKTLPEVQQKLINNKEKQIKKANKLLADIFNQKLRQQVLKGKPTLPPDASIINLV